jgi:hypothetical protein
MPTDSRDLGDVQALLKQATNSFMAKVVEVKVIHLSTNAQMLERKADRVTRHGKHPFCVLRLGPYQQSTP